MITLPIQQSTPSRPTQLSNINLYDPESFSMNFQNMGLTVEDWYFENEKTMVLTFLLMQFHMPPEVRCTKQYK